MTDRDTASRATVIWMKSLLTKRIVAAAPHQRDILTVAAASKRPTPRRRPSSKSLCPGGWGFCYSFFGTDRQFTRSIAALSCCFAAGGTVH
jgi:hypothetical protein